MKTKRLKLTDLEPVSFTTSLELEKTKGGFPIIILPQTLGIGCNVTFDFPCITQAAAK